MPGRAAHVDLTAVSLHDPVRHRQPEARPFHLLGGEERVEHAGARVVVHADARVAHAHAHVVRVVRAGDPQVAAGGHGVHRVQHHVREHLAQLGGGPGDGLRRTQVQVQVHQHAAALGPRLPCRPRQLDDAVEHPVHVDRLEALSLAHARELLHAAHRLRAVERSLLDDVELAAHAGIVHGLEQELRAAEDRRQDVVEVVGDAAGHLAQRVQLRRLDQLRLGGAQLVVGELHALVEARVGDRGAALAGEQRGQLEVLLLESARSDPRQCDHPEDAVARDERHAQERALLRGRAGHGERARVGLCVVHDLALAGERHVPGDALAGFQAHGEHLLDVGERIAHGGHEHVLALLVKEHRALVGLDDLADLLGDRGEHGVQVERVHHRMAHGEQRAELLALVSVARGTAVLLGLARLEQNHPPG